MEKPWLKTITAVMISSRKVCLSGGLNPRRKEITPRCGAGGGGDDEGGWGRNGSWRALNPMYGTGITIWRSGEKTPFRLTTDRCSYPEMPGKNKPFCD